MQPADHGRFVCGLAQIAPIWGVNESPQAWAETPCHAELSTLRARMLMR
jgi:hypothetical protein